MASRVGFSRSWACESACRVLLEGATPDLGVFLRFPRSAEAGGAENLSDPCETFGWICVGRWLLGSVRARTCKEVSSLSSETTATPLDGLRRWEDPGHGERHGVRGRAGPKACG